MKISLLVLSLLLSSSCFADSNNRDAEKDAIQAIFTATYKQTGIEDNINKYIENHIPREHRDLLGRVTLVVNTVITQRMSYKWTF